MPRVPQSQRQVFEKPIGNIRSDVRPSAEAFGAGKVADLHKQALTHAVKGAKTIVDDFDKTEVKRARRELQTYANQKETEFRLLKNKQPSLSRKQFDEEWEAEYSKIAEELGNDSQRSMFGEIKADFDVSRKARYGNHQLSEAVNYQNDEDKASIAADAQSAANSYNNRTAIAGNLKAQEIVYKDLALRNGDATEDEEGNIILTKDGQKGLNAIKSKTHLAVVQRAITEKQPKIAQQYFDSIKDDETLSIADKERMLKLTSNATMLNDVQSFTDKIMAQNMEEGDALKLARSSFSGEEEEMAVRHIKNRYAEASNLKKKTDHKIHETLMTGLMNSSGKLELDGTEQFNDLPHNMRQSALKYQQQLLAGVQPKTNYKVWTSLNTDMFRDNAEGKKALNKFMKEGPWQYRPYLNDSHYDSLLRTWKDLNESGKDGKERLMTVAAERQAETRGIRAIGLDPSNRDNTPYEKQLIDEYSQELYQKKIAWRRANNNQHIPPEVHQTMIDTVTLMGVQKGWFEDQQYYFQLKGNEGFKHGVDMDKISASSKRRAKDALHRKGIMNPTDAQVLKEIQSVTKFR